jgi:hypothetical protein
MAWILKKLWLIPALPMLAAGLSALTSREKLARQTVGEYTFAV